jgi:hypothetical protein
VPLCSNRDLSTFLRQIANSTFDRSSFIFHQTVEIDSLLDRIANGLVLSLGGYMGIEFSA